MKRFVLWSFILIVIFCNIPSVQKAAQNPLIKTKETEEIPQEFLQAREEQIKKRKEKNPHESLIDLDQYVGQVEQNTKALASKLPLTSNRNKINKISTQSAESFSNLIDKEIFGTLASRNVKAAEEASDEEFCRRVFLDITGRQPSPQRLLQYIDDKTPEKKEKLIDELIASQAYIDFWSLWFGDLTSNFALNSRSPFERDAQHKYLQTAIASNKPYDQIAKELITAVGDYQRVPSSLILHNVIFAEVSQDAFDDMAGQTSSIFLGTQSTCISCHNGEGHLEAVNLYFSTKKRSDFWAMSSFFAQVGFSRGTITNFKQQEYNANTSKGMRPPRSGGIIAPSYALFGNSEIQANEERRQALARMLTSDPQFAKAFVNRVFARFFTLGLVEPLNGFDLARLDPKNPPPAPWTLQPSHPVLLNNLATWFVESGYDLRKLIKLVASSKTYALSSSYDEKEWKPEYTRLFARKLVRRLQAEEVLDAITTSTQIPANYYVKGLSQPLTSAIALPGVEEPVLGGSGADDPIVVGRFLNNFGRGDRNNQPRFNDSSITQALDLFNSSLLINRLENPNSLPSQIANNLAQNKLSPEDAVVTLYLNTLSRQPSKVEIDKLKEHTKAGRQAIADLQWLLINQPDFLYNY
ncbi:MAG: DUF1553 domain-containing protein [Acidobacteria bacterium]|nr:DUF1553 domain-containing protein [Acidobacteriota bacterium]